MMKAGIIAIVLALAALGLAGFATFTSLNDDETTPVAESTWSAAKCERAERALENIGPAAPISFACFYHQNCAPYADMLQAINNNCE